jgi:hypothetical protein
VMTGDMGDGDWRVSDSRTDCIVTIAKKTWTDVLRRLDQPTLAYMKRNWVKNSAIALQDWISLGLFNDISSTENYLTSNEVVSSWTLTV